MSRFQTFVLTEMGFRWIGAIVFTKLRGKWPYKFGTYQDRLLASTTDLTAINDSAIHDLAESQGIIFKRLERHAKHLRELEATVSQMKWPDPNRYDKTISSLKEENHKMNQKYSDVIQRVMYLEDWKIRNDH